MPLLVHKRAAAGPEPRRPSGTVFFVRRGDRSGPAWLLPWPSSAVHPPEWIPAAAEPAAMAEQFLSEVSAAREYLEFYRAKSGLRDADGTAAPRVVVQFPDTLSVIDAPSAALGVAEDIVRHALAGTGTLHFDQKGCVDLAACAGTLSALLAAKARDAGVLVTSDPPADPVAYAILASLALCGNGAPNEPYPADVAVREIEQLHKLDPIEYKSAVLNVVTSWIGRQFESQSYALPIQFIRRLGDYLGEAVENGIEHGAGYCWFTVVVRKNILGAIGRVELIILNLGDTIDETLMRMRKGDLPRVEIEGLIERHDRAGHFAGGWTREALLVRHAFQDRVTSYGSRERHRGVGLMRMIRHYEHLVDSSPPDFLPRLGLITGRTHVRLNPRHRLRPSRSARRELPILDIAFNEENSFELPADDDCFGTADRRFPGTLLSLHFTVTSSHLEKRDGR